MVGLEENMTLKVNILLPTFVFSKSYRDSSRSASSRNEILDQIKLDYRQTKSRIVSNVGGWQQSVEHDSPLYSRVREEIITTVEKQMMPWLGVSKAKCFLHNMWANVNTRGTWNKPHTHDGCFYSGVYFLTTPKECGDLVLLNTHKNIQDAAPYAPKLRAEHRIKPQRGMMYLFPSGLYHMVEPSNSDELRVSIAFNLSVASSPDDRMDGNHDLLFRCGE